MKKILLTSALVMLGATSMASAQSLLDGLLANAVDIQNTMGNVAENLGQTVDGSIDITLNELNVPAVDANSLATVVEPLNAKLGALSTTVIGSLGTGDVTSTLNLADVTDVQQAMSATSSALNAQFAAGNSLAQIYNMTSNLADIDAAATIVTTGVNVTDLASLGTTAIGSLGTGTITTNVTNNAAGLTNRLIGSN